MKKRQVSKENSSNLRRCSSNEHLFMEIIPQFSEPYFVRKKTEELRSPRGSSLTSRKNKLIEVKKSQINKDKNFALQSKNVSNYEGEDSKIKRFNSPMRSERYPLLHSQSELETNITNFQVPENVSQINFSDQKVSSSAKSVKFSNRLEDTRSINSKRSGNRTPSILKKKNKKVDHDSGLINFPSERSFSINQSFHSNQKEIKKRIIQQSNSNNIIKKKYEVLLKNLDHNSKKPPLPGKKYLKVDLQKDKYKDQIFPPIFSSIFPFNSKDQIGKNKKGNQIEWKRISEVFPNQKLTIFDKPEQLLKYFDSSKQQSKIAKISAFRDKNSYVSEYFVTALNAVKNNQELLEKIFENQQINDYGIYLLKIFQENAWKYIIIDDFIPVVRSNLVNTENPYIPAFVNIKPQIIEKEKKGKKKGHTDEILPIWPLLLEKAYANYYGSYEALMEGNTVDILEQFCGVCSEKVSLVEKTDAQEYLEVIDKLLLGLKNGNIVVVGQLKQTLPMIPFYYKAEYCYSMITEQELIYYDPNQDYRPNKIKFYDLGLICTHLFLFPPLKYPFQVNCTISKPKHKLSSNLLSRIHNDQNIVPRDIPTVRKFSLKSPSQCLIFIRQKQKRLLYRLRIQYFWLRVILIGKDYDGTFRWIDGEYSNNKSISFNHYLEAGEYFILLYPEWSKQKYHQQIHSTLFTNEAIDSLERVVFNSKQRMLEQSCTDLAQKKGKLNQINKFICSYTYVDKKAALVIENINNQRLFGEVNIVRSIVGLKCLVEIVPVNDEFYEDLKQESTENGAEYLAAKKNSIDVKIEKGESYTVILKMRGGIDEIFFRAFTFGT